MKFEKFLKSVGMFGVVYKANDGTKFLRCGKSGNVLARIPDDFSPISYPFEEQLDGWVQDEIVENADNLKDAELFAAKLEKDGKAKDIKRIFADDSAKRRVTIDQAAFAIIERGDEVRIFVPELDDIYPSGEYENVTDTLVVLTRGEIVGIIFGVDDE